MRTPILLIFLIGFSIIYDVAAYPSKQNSKHEPADNAVYGIQHCIHMTPENEEKISAIVVKLSEYLYNLTIEHEVFDIRLLKIVIEGHSDDEVEEKDTQIQLVINDCAQSKESADAEELEEILSNEDPYEKKGAIVVDFSGVEDTQPEDNPEGEYIRATEYNDATQQSDDETNDTNTQNEVTEYNYNTFVIDNVDESTATQDEAENNGTGASDNAKESTANDDQATTLDNSSTGASDNTEESTANDDQATTQDNSSTGASDNAEDSTANDDQATTQYQELDTTDETSDDQVEESISNGDKAATNDEVRCTTDDLDLEDSGIDIDGIPRSSAANYDVPGPVLVRLDLDKNGNRLIKGTQAKRGEHVPLVLYVQKFLGNMEYLFAN